MTIDAAALAAILDPERKVPGWWDSLYKCSECGLNVAGPEAVRSECPSTNKPYTPQLYERFFTGPEDLHTAREHNWRLEEWLEARGYGWRRNWFSTEMTSVVSPSSQTRETETLARNPNHTAALVAAIERIASELL